MGGLRDLQISPRRVIPGRYLSAQFARSGGPGGQNVNKVSTKAEVRLDLDAATELLGEGVVSRIREQLASRLDKLGRLLVTSNTHREQAQNLEEALSRMEALIAKALERPKPRRPTKPTRGSQERRLSEKRRRGEQKRERAGD